MSKIEQMHLDVIEDKIYYDERKYEVNGKSSSAFKSTEITKNIAIEFVKWYENRDKKIDENMLTWEDYYREFLKTKQ